MSAALQTTIEHTAVTLLDRLSCADPTAADLRARAAFWRQYLRTTPGLTADQVARVELACVQLDAKAAHMESPEPVATLVTTRTTRTKPDNVRVSGPRRAAAPRAAAKPAAMTADRFWTLHGEAVAAIRAVHGGHWYSHAPLSETVVLTVPGRLCTMAGPLGGKIKWRRDHRMPAAQYWPDGMLPDCGLEIAPAPVDQGPLPGAGVAEIVAEQILQDKRHRLIAAARMRHAQALRGGLRSQGTAARNGTRPAAWRMLYLSDAAEIRRELAADLFAWKVSVGLVDGAEYGVDAERDLATEEV